VGVRLGNGDGSFQAPSTVAVGPRPFSVSVADLNDDGRLDLVVPDFVDAKVRVFLGNGDGSFRAQASLTVGERPLPSDVRPSSVEVADVNGDGRLDLVVANFEEGSVSVLPGNGDGSFAEQKTYPVGRGPYSVAVADVNGDGRPDLVVPNFGEDKIADVGPADDDQVGVLLGNGDGSFFRIRRRSPSGKVQLRSPSRTSTATASPICSSPTSIPSRRTTAR